MIKPERILSVDFLRGLTVAAMILVNNPGSWEHLYAPLGHAHWNGCTPTDLVFPFFLFIVGISISYSLGVSKDSSTNQNPVILKILKRSAILFLLGLILNIVPEFDFTTLRIPGVLQRIGIVFLISALLFLKTSIRGQVYISIFILMAYWVLLSFVPVPGIGPSNMDPTTNMAAWLDNLLLKGHLWRFSKVWDPEGILSTLPAVVSGMIGVLTGTWLKTNEENNNKVIRLFIFGNILIVAALAWDMIFPINKSLWTSSYVLYTSGIALNVLGVCFWWVDLMKNKKYTEPFLVFGSNAIAAYMLSELLAKILYINIIYHEESISIKEVIFHSLSFEWINLKFLSLVLALIWVALIWLPVQQLYKRKIFIKV